MPCMDYSDPTPQELNLGQEVRALRKRNDMLARAACSALTVLQYVLKDPSVLGELILENGGRLDREELVFPLLARHSGLSKSHYEEIEKWWTAHQAEDKKRRLAEEVDASLVQAFSSLSLNQLEAMLESKEHGVKIAGIVANLVRSRTAEKKSEDLTKEILDAKSKKAPKRKTRVSKATKDAKASTQRAAQRAARRLD